MYNYCWVDILLHVFFSLLMSISVISEISENLLTQIKRDQENEEMVSEGYLGKLSFDVLVIHVLKSKK